MYDVQVPGMVVQFREIMRILCNDETYPGLGKWWLLWGTAAHSRDLQGWSRGLGPRVRVQDYAWGLGLLCIQILFDSGGW